MTLVSSRPGWWRGLLAAAVLWGLLIPAPIAPALSPPAWLANAICHAPEEDGAPHPDHPPAHLHCGLCQMGQLVGTLPVPPALTLPGMAGMAPIRLAIVLWPGPGAVRLYASRAPPSFG